MVKNPPASTGAAGSIPALERSPWRRKWQPSLVFLPGEAHGQSSLVGYRPCGCKEWNTAERLSTQPKMDVTSLVPGVKWVVAGGSGGGAAPRWMLTDDPELQLSPSFLLSQFISKNVGNFSVSKGLLFWLS